MSVASSNPFALLGEEGPAAPAAKTAPKKTEAPKPAREVPGAPKRQTGRKGPAPPREESFATDGNVPRESRRAPRGETRGRGRGGRPRGGGHGRAFDRHSGTAHNDSPKTLEQGWGGSDAKRELQAEDDGKADAKAENTAPGTAPGTPAEPAAPTEEAPVPAEPEDKTLTLDEYLASLAEKKAAINAKREVRQVESAPEAAKPVKKASEAEESYFASTAKGKAHNKAKKERPTEQVDTAFSFASPERPGRGRPRDGPGFGGRGRGAGRGRGGRGGRGGGRAPQGGRNQPDLNLEDSKAFPSLGA